MKMQTHATRRVQNRPKPENILYYDHSDHTVRNTTLGEKITKRQLREPSSGFRADALAEKHNRREWDDILNFKRTQKTLRKILTQQSCQK